jgi:uncharacterized protein (UPF0212 family)
MEYVCADCGHEQSTPKECARCKESNIIVTRIGLVALSLPLIEKPTTRENHGRAQTTDPIRVG